MKCIEYARKHGLDKLISNYDLKANYVGNLVVLNYRDTFTTICDITNECRALILHAPTLDVVSMSFKRFFNYGTLHAVKIDWNTANVIEKVDGSLMVLYYNDGRWNVQTRSNPHGNQAISEEFNVTFASNFWNIVKTKYTTLWELIDGGILNENLCFAFKMVTPKLPHTKKYLYDDIYLLGIFNKLKALALTTDRVKQYATEVALQTPTLYKLNTAEDVIETANKVLSADEEGFVVTDKDNNRIKIKNKRHLQLAKQITRGRPLKGYWYMMILSGNADEARSFFPDNAEEIDQIEETIKEKLSTIEREFQSLNKIRDQKQFAMKVMKIPYSAYFFTKRKNPNLTVMEFLNYKPKTFYEKFQRMFLGDNK